MQDYPRIVQTIEESPLIDLLISHLLPMCNAAEAFAWQAAGECATIILEPWG